MRRPKSFLNTLYDRDPKSKAYIISVRIDNYRDLFNDLDPSPLRRRDLDQDFIAYLDDSSLDIPLASGICLQVHAPEAIRDTEKESRVMAGLRTYYRFLYHDIQRKLSASYRQFVLYLGVALVSLLVAFNLGSILPQDFLSRTLEEGFYIGGWVFFWEALVVLAFKNRDLRAEGKRYRRTAEAPIEFFYTPPTD